MVVEAERTEEPDLAQAIEMLDAEDRVQLVLNRARAPFGARRKSD
jgi:hypothetical protein